MSFDALFVNSVRASPVAWLNSTWADLSIPGIYHLISSGPVNHSDSWLVHCKSSSWLWVQAYTDRTKHNIPLCGFQQGPDFWPGMKNSKAHNEPFLPGGNLNFRAVSYRRPTWLTRGTIWPNYKYKTSSNLSDSPRHFGSQVVTKEMKAFKFFGLWQRFFGKRGRVYILFWLRIAVKWFPHGEQVFRWRQLSLNMCWQSVSVSGTASTQPSYYHFYSQHKSSKTCTNKGPEKLENFPGRERENHSPNSSRVRTNNRFSRPLYILGTPLVLISGLETVPCRQTRKLF